ncbi:phospholipase D-like domain-containing protein [Bacillus cereus]|uniref:phospholipase D-like domain-containing protein n=1 Tax=Bacillus cereus TaxID=1396 RepID=UPI00099D36A6|nr:phospholipase D-like domain-containing protein [Bacillus cereus]MDZ4488793.1 phospholipase D-like domain-containing protein [Bacillus cereus]NSL59041.1 hypothetical protein [Bacillus cereus]OPD51494.1 hypothetical protein BVG00_06190 [Bacillus cereus]
MDSNFEGKVACLVYNCLSRGNDTLLCLKEQLRKQDVLSDIDNLVDYLEFPFDLADLSFEMLKEAKLNNISVSTILVALDVAENMYRIQKKVEPRIYPIWTGPTFEDSPIMYKTHATVKRLFQAAKMNILVVGYTFSLEQEPVNLLFQELVSASERGCRIDIIYHNDEKNLENIKRSWPSHLVLPNLYYWKGSKETKYASLHSKLIMVDQNRLLLTSANFSLHGFKENIETGVLIETPLITKQIWRQFYSLLSNKEMVKY